jgi:MoxR-like ATPase
LSTEEIGAEHVEAVRSFRERVLAELRKRIIGQDEVIELMLTSLLAGGHGLFVGVPGLAKTLLISTLAETMSLEFSRIQFTPDLMPSDVTGAEIMEEDPSTGKRVFRFVKGPIFCQILLADEVNRTPPKTQAALLEAMAERQVTAGATTHALQAPFVVFATQNPIEQEGTYPLPEAQLDRFMLSIHVDYPSFDQEVDIVARTTSAPVAPVEIIAPAEELLELQRTVLAIITAPDVVRYAVEVVSRTRPDSEHAPELVRQYVSWGAGPRASQHLILAAKARAALQGRPHASREDVARLAPSVLRHRVLTTYQAEAQGVGPAELIAAVLDSLG